jgi:hypothetical protein
MMRPRFLLACALALAACRPTATPMPDLFTEVAGAWHRTSLRELPPSLAPDSVPAAAIERIRAATYEGPGKLEARMYQLTSAAVALDVVQRWRPSPDTVFFYHDRFLVLIQWHTADRKALQEFIGALEKKFTVKGQPR